MELASPFFPAAFFLPMLCFGSIARSVTGALCCGAGIGRQRSMAWGSPAWLDLAVSRTSKGGGRRGLLRVLAAGLALYRLCVCLRAARCVHAVLCRVASTWTWAWACAAGVAGGATRAALTQHFAQRGNAADISAKEQSQVRGRTGRWVGGWSR